MVTVYADRFVCISTARALAYISLQKESKWWQTASAVGLPVLQWLVEIPVDLSVSDGSLPVIRRSLLLYATTATFVT